MDIFTTITRSDFYIPDHGKITRLRVYYIRLIALLRLAFTTAAAVAALTKPRIVTRRIILQKARRQGRGPSDGLEAHDFRVCFTPLAGVLFTVPSRYCALSVAACSLPWTVVSPASAQVLRAWAYSGAAPRSVTDDYGTLTRCGGPFQTLPASAP